MQIQTERLVIRDYQQTDLEAEHDFEVVSESFVDLPEQLGC